MVCSEKQQKKQAAVGFEPTDNGFANRRLRPLGYAAISPTGIDKILGSGRFCKIFNRSFRIFSTNLYAIAIYRRSGGLIVDN